MGYHFLYLACFHVECLFYAEHTMFFVYHIWYNTTEIERETDKIKLSIAQASHQ